MFTCVVLCLQYIRVKWSSKHVNMKKRCCWGEMTDVGVLSGACVILTSPLTVSQLKMCMCVWERASERQRVECTCSCKYLHRESKSRATVMSQYKCWAKIRQQIKQPMNHFSKSLLRKKYLWKISVGCRKCCGPWSLTSIYSAMTSKKAFHFFHVLLQIFWGGYG